MPNRKVVAIIQARMGSSRLPGKVMQDLGGKPVLARVVARVKRAQLIDDIWVATTQDAEDEAIVAWCNTNQVNHYQGDEYDVLDRYYQAALQAEADVVVRITADCPMIDPSEIDRVVRAYLEGHGDFVSNRLPPPFIRTTPIGMDVEVVGIADLRTAWEHAEAAYEREHVMPYFYDKAGRFRVYIVETTPSLGHLRFTIDTPEDLELAREIYAFFYNQDTFNLQSLLWASHHHPEWQVSVSQIRHKDFHESDERARQAHEEPGA